MRLGSLMGALASSLLLVLVFPGPDLGWLSTIALIPLLVAVRSLGGRRAFFYGWVTGFVWFFVSLNWISQTISRYGDFPFPLNQLAIVLMASIYALYIGGFAAAVPISHRIKGTWQVFFLASVWVLFEYLRSWIPAPFPWLLLGSAFWKSSLIRPFYSVGGVYSLSFLAVAANVLIWQALTAMFSTHRRAAGHAIGSLAAIGIIVLTAGFLVVPEYGSERTTVAVVQGNFPQEIKWQESVREETLATYIDMTDKAVAQRVDLTVWPETAVPFYFQSEEELAGDLRDFVNEKGVHLIFGSPAFMVREGEILFYNSAYHLEPDGEEERYDKVILVPFGEYVPFSRILPFLARLVPGEGEFATGGLQEPFRTPFRTGTLICFEMTFPHLSRRQVSQGAQILVNITNDGWFGSTWGPYQHLAVSAIRAAENGVPVIRAANTGVSAVFDARGRLMTSMGLFERGFIKSEISVGGSGTIYTKTGDWIVYTAVVMILFISLIILRNWRKYRWTISMNSDRT
ncbi:apolipoprotein N-acyltransferase [bacterium]|nr:MAG: apolipoprotein N-acyltransferase [bacterium]